MMYTEDIKPKILYIDDEEDNLLVFKSSFRRDYHIETASSVKSGNEILKWENFDIIISDQRMPDTTGVEFLKNMDGSQLRIIMSGYSDMEAVADALNSGKIYKYIKKPWKKEELKETLDE